MTLSTEAIVAIVALFIAVAQLFYTIWKTLLKDKTKATKAQSGSEKISIMRIHVLIV
jgi:hypothetical protein